VQLHVAFLRLTPGSGRNVPNKQPVIYG